MLSLFGLLLSSQKDYFLYLYNVRLFKMSRVIKGSKNTAKWESVKVFL